MKRLLSVISVIFITAAVLCSSVLISHRFLLKHPQPQKGKRITVISYNTQRMNDARKADKNEVIKYILEKNADIVCLQEVDVYKDRHYLTLPELKQALSKYQYTYFDFKIYNSRRQYGNAVFSRYPLINKHTIQYASRANITSCCDICIKDDTLRLFVNHLESNRIAQNEIDSAVQSVSLKHKGILSKMRKAGMFRTKQAGTVKAAVDDSPYPSIVAGDFNAPPVSFTYLKMSRNMKDCFLYCSNLKTGNTWIHDNLGIRIDYILCSKQLIPLDFTIDHHQGSDHFPIRATIGW